MMKGIAWENLRDWDRSIKVGFVDINKLLFEQILLIISSIISFSLSYSIRKQS